MSSITFESLKETGNGYKIYFTSYLREDFVEKSVVVTLKKDFTVSCVYFSSYDHGSVEWINGTGLSESRKWETEEQAEAPGYLTRRYTARISDGPAPAGLAENLLIPSLLESMENRDVAGILAAVVKTRKSKRKIIPAKCGLS